MSETDPANFPSTNLPKNPYLPPPSSLKSSRSHRTLSEAGYRLTGHLGNTTVLFRDADEDGQIAAEGSGPAAGEVMQRLWYYPFGLQLQGIGRDEPAPAHLYRYNGKAWDPASGLSDYGARWYDSGSGRWSGVDPLASKMPSWSPYNYVFNNPILFIDPDGTTPETVKPTGETEEQRQGVLTMIRNTLSAEDAQYVQLDADGNIDKGLLNSHSSLSENYAALSDLVNSDQMVEVSTASSFDYVDQDGNPGTEEFGDVLLDEYSTPDPNGGRMAGTTTGEEGSLGKTLFPDRNGGQNSPDGVLRVVVNEGLSEAGRAELYSHEANGHARVYVITNGDREAASHQPVGIREANIALKQRILTSKKETIQHMKNRKQ